MDTTTAAAPAVTAARPARRRDRALAVLAATAATLTGWVAAVPVAGVDLVVRNGGTEQSVTAAAVGVSTLLAGLAAWALLALLERFTGRARAVWTGTAGLVLLLSLLGPLGGGVGTAATLTLVALHLVAAAVLLPLLRRTARR
ncbi:DUF6069 family protein [Micromonospora chaiyaphumensis]|uniref:Uncharacterized protein n=1 Tax=Micromonospora chaiyaphumensis TaxID=307119 RepID=A0A1C4U3M9_9ACTN|nr:DUF6069 family protein [Micromonospora chaiyaphumensis]SCE66229.1 hypothetical protein GA0070214_101315 [Micromonospora chaiyaphumensis]